MAAWFKYFFRGAGSLLSVLPLSSTVRRKKLYRPNKSAHGALLNDWRKLQSDMEKVTKQAPQK